MPRPQTRRPASGSSVRLEKKRDLFLKTEIKYPEMTNTIAALNPCACSDVNLLENANSHPECQRQALPWGGYFADDSFVHRPVSRIDGLHGIINSIFLFPSLQLVDVSEF